MLNRSSLVLLCLLPGCVGTCDGTTNPSSETCEPGAPQGAVSELDIGRYLDGSFTQYQDGDIVPLVYGGQGFPMLVFNLRVRGSDLPGCLPQVTRVYRDDGQIEGSEELPLVTEQVLPDTWITGEMLIVTFDAFAGDRVLVESQAGGAVGAVELWVDYVGALPDAAVVWDATPVADAAPPDAAPPDAAP
jgi:hypothetical protein